MRSVKQILGSIEAGGGEVARCLRCGEAVSFAPGQWRRRCPGCGLTIALSRPYRRVLGLEAAERPRCIYCRDTGVLIVEEQRDCYLFERAYRCICEKGLARPEKALPVAYDVDLSQFLREGEFLRGGGGGA